MVNTKLLHDFVTHWTGHGYEKGESQPFWLALLRALGVEEPDQFISFEQRVKIDQTAFIDGYIPSTKVLIEQKSDKRNLGDPILQSDHSFLDPYQQAKRYAAELPRSQHPRYIVTCNFREFWVYDMEQPNAEPQKIFMENLEKEHYRLKFLVDQGSDTLKKEMELSMKAGDLVGLIYDALLPQYADSNNKETQQSLNQLCVRLVFCLFAEDAGLFGDKNEFHDYIEQFPAKGIRRALIDLFKVLDTKIEDRDPYLDDDLKSFPYVNGGLFSNENIEIPQFTDELRNLILSKASEDFDWSEISPTIFGAVFESTLNPDTRRKGGMHYTSIENIHKVIDPLFLNQLNHEFDACTSTKDYQKFQDKLSSLTFFDPACGSGNFLTETYISLRRLENKVIKKLQGNQMVMAEMANPIKVDIHQFYGIEINDFAVSVATTALWIAELQMMHETEKIASFNVDPLPLKTYHNIHEGNALTTDWAEIIAPEKLNYIMGNPPFVGYKEKDASQKSDLELVCKGVSGNAIKNVGSLDYVAGWYYKAAKYLSFNPQIKAALVSTNSITQGEQVALLWRPLIEDYRLCINFAYPTFRWDSESNLKAHVHCVIIGFSLNSSKEGARLYLPDGTYKLCKNINGYLVDASNSWIYSRHNPICNVKPITLGVHIFDNHNFIFTQQEQKEFIDKEPQSERFFRKWVSANDFIDGNYRYYLDLQTCSPSELKAMPLSYERVKRVLEYRASNPSSKGTCLAMDPYMPKQGWKADGDYIAIPNTSSEKRRYIPITFMSKDVVITMPDLAIPGGGLYDFGILISEVHMNWMRAVCGRLEMRYRYANGIVYNNFPWPTPTPEQQAKIEQTAQAILDVRAKYPECSLADLYDDVSMPADLRKAHQDNDRAVMAAYGFDIKLSESDCVARLLEMYQQLTK